MVYTSPYSSVDLKEPDFRKQKAQTFLVVQDVLQGRSLFNYANQVVRCVPADVIRYVSQSKRLLSDSLYRSCLINFVLSCERKCAGSGIVFLMFLSNHPCQVEYKKSRVDVDDLKKVVKTYFGNGNISSHITDIFLNCGFEYSIKFLKSQEESLGVVQESSTVIDGHLDPAFYDVEYSGECLLVCTEGKIETIGEIDALLSWSTEYSKKVLLMAESIGLDVSNTLKVNYDSKKLNVLPVIINNSEIRKISALGNKVIESKSGLRFGNLDYSEFENFEVSVKNNKVEILGHSGNSSVVKIFMPSAIEPIHSIIEERIRCGLAIIKNAAYGGIASIGYGGEEVSVPRNSYEHARRAFEEWKKMMNISCTVTLQ